LIRIEGLELRRGPEALLVNSAATIHPGQNVGLIGSNGCGKSSLFALLKSEIELDSGTLKFPSNWRIASVAQETPAVERSVLQYTIDADIYFRQVEGQLAHSDSAHDGEAYGKLLHDFETLDGYTMESRAAKLLNGLGFSEADQQRAVASYSGGWRMRINLARALLCPSELLLLDEPTNHLDLDAVLWLERWLLSYPGTLILISHDREFLDRVVQIIIHVERQQLFSYTGNYSSFEKQRAEQLAQQQSIFEKEQRQRAHLQNYIDRFRYQATKAKQAQSRIKALEKLQSAAPALAASGFDFRFREPDALSSPLLVLDQVKAGYGDKVILKNICLNIQPGARLGLLGRNGAGKSTLIKLLAEQLQPMAGEIVRGGNLKVGYFAQHQLEALDLNASPMLHIQRLSPEAREQTLRDFLGGFGFQGKDVDAEVGPFSGGEKARLALALLVWQKPNLLLLDEPTNHLDINMREALIFAVQDFEGAVLVVSHDRHMLSTVVDELLLVADGKVNEFPSDLATYNKMVLSSSIGASSTVTSSVTEVVTPSVDRKERKRLEANFRASVSPLKKTLKKLEQLISELEAQLGNMEEQLGDSSLYEPGNSGQLKELLLAQGQKKTNIEEAEFNWMEQQEQLEALTAEFEKSLMV